MLNWFGNLATTVIGFGYPGVVIALIIEGLGLPFPGDAAMAFYGFAAARGNMHGVIVLVFSVVGYVIGATIAYTVSRVFGAEAMEKLGSRVPFWDRRGVMRTTRMIDRYGPWLLVPGRFLPGVRSVSSYVAGFTRMDPRLYVGYTILGASLWCTAWVSLGFWFGEHLPQIMRWIQSGLVYVTVTFLLVGLTVWWWRHKAV